MREVKDIDEELHMIEDVFRQQRKALLMFADILGNQESQAATDLFWAVKHRSGAVNQLGKGARQVYDSVCFSKILIHTNLDLLLGLV